MEEMNLFEIGFKNKPSDTGYAYKVYVGAEDAEEAILKARRWIVHDFDDWYWEDSKLSPEESEKVKREEYERLLVLPLARVQHIGELFI